MDERHNAISVPDAQKLTLVNHSEFFRDQNAEVQPAHSAFRGDNVMALPTHQPTPPLWDDQSNVFSLAPLRRQIDRLFEDFNDPTPGWFSRAGSFGFWPPAEIHEADKTLTIRMELPGVEAKDLNVSSTQDSIVVSGEKKSDTKTSNGDRYHCERSFGAFTRTFSMPHGFEDTKVDATFRNGVLTISVPKPAGIEANARRIPVH